jgi:hypothetical protein|tara:strand:- start:930 stop:1190 length:261 start_codon:yes stop_codon:yes gene_type:complete
MKDEQLTLSEMKRGSLYRNMAKGRTERYIGSVSHIRPVMDFHKEEQEGAMIRDIRLATQSEVDQYIDETNARVAGKPVISRVAPQS